MTNIQFIEYGTNRELMKQALPTIPRVGEYIIMSPHVEADWKQKFHIVRAVSYTLGGDIIVHLEQFDIDAAEEKERAFREQWAQLRKGKTNGIQA